jgi:hypothetical protein
MAGYYMNKYDMPSTANSAEKLLKATSNMSFNSATVAL